MWSAIVRVVLGLVAMVGGFFGIRKSGERKARLAQAEKNAEVMKVVEAIENEPVPTDLDGVDDLMRDR